MGIVAFEWGNKQLTLLHNRDNLDTWTINAVAWDEGDEILCGRGLNPNGGTWCGISRHGRVAFLVDGNLFNGSIRNGSLPAEFLQGQMSPQDFAKEMAGNPSNYDGMSFHLIVADIISNSMCYVSKTSTAPYVHKEDVGFGVHTLCWGGLDTEHATALRMKDVLNEMIDEYKDKELPPPKEIAGRFMYDPCEAVEGDKLTPFLVDLELKGRRYRTTSTTALTMKPTNEVKFYERYLENGQWRDHDFPFKLKVSTSPS